MDNVFTYLKFRGDLTFSKEPFCELDSMVFAILVGLDYRGLFSNRITVSELWKRYEARNTHDERDERLKDKEALLKLAASTKRFGEVAVENYVCDINEEEEKTFYAITFYIGRFNAYVSFRGTDGYFISWKENFNGMCEFPTAGQKDALSYLTKVCEKPFVNVTVMGHSKGANLAVYAASFVPAKLRKKIKHVYSFDGPGYIEDLRKHEGFIFIQDRIDAFVPESSVVGRLMDPPCELTIVKAEGKGVYQHDLFNWNVNSTSIERGTMFDEFSNSISIKLNEWSKAIPLSERRNVVDELFDVFEKSGIKHVTDLTHIDFKMALTIGKHVTSLSSENRNLLVIVLKELIAYH